jgi:ABC-type branched-subunit amino acid transport system ATPase component
MADEPILSVSGLDFAYGQLQILFGINLEVRRGEALALLGTNGAGKSTLLKVISGMARPSAGTVCIDGVDVSGVPAEKLVKRGLVLVRGGHGVFPDMTVAENLDLQALILGRDRALIAQRRQAVFERFPRLAERLDNKAGSMSGGEQQQLALAKALLLDPTVLCIDELSLGLAPIVVQELIQIVRSIHDGGTTVVLVEQSLNIAAELCQRAVFLEKGQVRFEGPTKDLLERDDIARAVFLGA